ncbi:hypothetical protein HK100_007078 [Physocladia obscura]|uniref:Vacuolar fusion protein MON1 n=1 Tax=Physocladia obscura TaxID=109957 RepID=A0AAD5X8G5_9FUNG|nr:hypothetical protein HK100_007078 [Physocladia obscura]
MDPRDVSLLSNLIASNCASFRVAGIEAWMPVCLAHLDPTAFLNLYVCCVVHGRSSGGESESSSDYLGSNKKRLSDDDDVFLVCCSVNREGFFDVSEYKRQVTESLFSKEIVIRDMQESLDTFPSRLTNIGIPRIRHFVCRVKRSKQYTECDKSPPYTMSADYERLQLLYQIMHAKLYPSDGIKPSKFVYIKGPHDAVAGMTTNSYDIFAAFHPLTTKKEVEEDIMALYRWIKKMDSSLFSE